MTDRGRSEVYAAESMAFDGTDLEELVPVDELRRTAAEVTGAEWWVAGDVEVRRARSDASSSSARWSAPGLHRVSIAAAQATRATLLHELAHVLAGPAAGHGSVFRRAHVDVVVAVVGAEQGTWLTSAYEAAGQAIGQRSWPEPPAADAPIAL